MKTKALDIIMCSLIAIISFSLLYGIYLSIEERRPKSFSPKIEIISSEDSFLINSIQIRNNYGCCATIRTTGELQEYVNQLEFALSKLKELEERAEKGEFNEYKY